MNLSMKWLSDFVNTDGLEIKKYCDRMTDTGSKVEGYEILAEDIKNVFVGRVTDIVRHENSDHLWVCTIDVGKENPVTIVTGAQNVFAGAIVPAAVAPASLPGGVTIKSGKLRGVVSEGMLCSFAELNLTEHDMPGAASDGILILDKAQFGDKVGCDIREALMLNNSVVEFEITSNRPDCLSVIGLARETAVSFERPLTLHTPEVSCVGDGDCIANYLSVGIDAPDLCYRYTAKVVKNVKIAPSPLWLRMRLRAAGVRPINNIVDITNYVMLEYGQPMHAFDYTCLDGSRINVRRAENGEEFVSLDDKKHTLDTDTLVIADAKKAVALAGVMGGANSEIKDTTATVVFESANFSGPEVRIAGKKQGMRTESSSRFEKGLDAENTLPALLRACELVNLLGAGDVVDGIIDIYPTKHPPVTLTLDADRINAFLGTDVSASDMVEILRRLEFTVDGDKITAPTFRADITCMNDVAEEIARIYGYNKIVSTPIRAETTKGGRTARQSFEIKYSSTLCALGFDEIQTFSFISPKFYDKIRLPENSPLRRSVVITNPLGEDTSVMRTTALPSMLKTLAHNNNHSNDDVRLYESATVYLPIEPDKLPDEKNVLTIGMFGASGIDFYSLKGVCENVFRLAGLNNIIYKACMDNPVFHPGRCATAYAPDGRELAVFGQVHPLTAANYDLDMPVYVAAIETDTLFSYVTADKQYTPLPKYPASTRDFSFVCSEELEIGTVSAVIKRAGGKLVEDIKLFDIYRGIQVGLGKKSVSFRVTLRAADHTLTVEEAEKVSAKILRVLSEELGITLRA